MYTYELHSHTSEVSGCANITAEQSIKLHTQAGYAGLVITNHFVQYGENKEETEAKIKHFIDGYYLAKNAAKDITVLFGMELRFFGSVNDYLVFGMTPELLQDNHDILHMDQPTFYDFAQKHGLLIIQAHPFRSPCTPSDPAYIHGVEIFNGNPRHDSRNDIAVAFCKQHSLIPTSGSDFHELEDIGIGGIITQEPIKDEKHLTRILLSGKYELKTK